MRLIDADAWERFFYEHMSDEEMIRAKIALDEMPTIDERPHGEWKFIGDNLLVCTECGYVNDATWLGNWRLRTCDSTYPHACPNCGAKIGSGE